MNYHFDVERLRNEIRSLVRDNPELEQDEVLKADMIEGETSFEEVMDVLLRGFRQNITMDNALLDEIETLKRRLERIERRITGLRSLIFFLMQEAGIKKLERPLGTLSVANGRPSLVVTNELLIPDQFWRVKREVDKKAIAEHLKAVAQQGGLAGVSGVGWSNAAPHLTIRT